MDMIEQFEKWFTGEEDCKTRKAMMEKDDAGYYKFQSAYNSFSSWKEAWQQQQAEITRLTALVESYKGDAERYRYMRKSFKETQFNNGGDFSYPRLVWHLPITRGLTFEQRLDESIDQAMKDKG